MTFNQEIKIAGLIPESIVEGPGLRMVVFFQGCLHHCPGCHNPQTWNFAAGESIRIGEILRQFSSNPLLQGITLSGGDPFFQAAAAASLAGEVHDLGKDVWTYTGFTWESFLKEQDPNRLWLLNSSDVLVDGPFILSKKTTTLPFIGSTNQRIIDIQSSFRQNSVIEMLVD